MNSPKSSKELMQFVVAAGGNLPLAAERAGVSKTDLVSLITGDDTVSLSENLRAMILLSTFETIMQTNIAFRASLSTMSPDAISKAYASQLTAFSQLSTQPTSDLGSAQQDAAAVKQKLVTRLDTWRKNKPTPVDVESQVEDVS